MIFQDQLDLVVSIPRLTKMDVCVALFLSFLVVDRCFYLVQTVERFRLRLLIHVCLVGLIPVILPSVGKSFSLYNTDCRSRVIYRDRDIIFSLLHFSKERFISSSTYNMAKDLTR